MPVWLAKHLPVLPGVLEGRGGAKRAGKPKESSTAALPLSPELRQLPRGQPGQPLAVAECPVPGLRRPDRQQGYFWPKKWNLHLPSVCGGPILQVLGGYSVPGGLEERCPTGPGVLGHRTHPSNGELGRHQRT